MLIASPRGGYADAAPPSRRSSNRLVTWLLVGASCAALASCAGTTPATPATTPTLTGWKLTLPIAGPKGGAAIVDPAALAPPWLADDGNGGLTFWAPASGATTAHSEHARTELNSLDNFEAGSGVHTLTALLSVSQVPAAGQDVILGQIHGAGPISSVPFIMLHYQAGTINVVVKRQQSGSAADKYELLSGVPLGTRFSYSIRDNGDGTSTFTANDGTRNATKDAPLPAAFRGATVRFQAGAYQLSSAAPGTAPDDDGARVTFYSVSTGSG